MAVTPQQRRAAIQAIESRGSGGYKAVGPRNSRFGRALGAYQIMEANISPWSKEILGREVSVNEFMAKPEIQDAIFDGKFEQYVDRFGEEGAAQAWFAGPGGVGKVERTDVLGTDVGSYGAKYLQELGRAPSVILGGAGDDQLAGGAGADTITAFDLGAAMNELLAAPTDQPDPAAVYADTAGLDLGAAMDELLGAAPAAEERIAQPPSIDVNTAPIPEQTGRFELDITRSTAQPMIDVAGAAMRGATGAGPSVVGQMLPEGTPGFVGRAGDVGLAALSGIGAATTGAAGLAGDVAEAAGMSPGSSRRLARDLAAIPEAFSGSPQGVAGRTQVATRRVDVPAPVAGGAARMEPPLSATPTPSAITESADAEFGALVREAATKGERSAAAKKLAQRANIDPEALRAANELGFQVPTDVLANNQQLRRAYGLMRSVPGTEVEAEWINTVIGATERADDLMDQVNASPDLSSISAQSLRQLQQASDDLKERSAFIYENVINPQVDKSARVDMPATRELIEAGLASLGGVERDLSPLERDVLEMLRRDGGVTYEALFRKKKDTSQSLGPKGGKYTVDTTPADLKAIEGALIEDQLNAARQLGGEGLELQMRVANGLFSKHKGVEKTIIENYGREKDGSIASTLRRAVRSTATTGDTGDFVKIMKAVPEPLRAEATMTAISSLARSKRGAAGAAENLPFGFKEYTDFYRGLRQNKEAYKAVASNLTPEQTAFLQDMYLVSRKMSDARANVLTTGKSLFALEQGMFAESVLEKFANSPGIRAARGTAAASAGTALGGPMGGAIGGAVGVSKIARDRVKATSQLFRSPQFQTMMEEASTTGAISNRTQRRLSRSGAFKQFAKRSGITDPQAWLAATVAAGQAEPAQEAE